jgi:hypothetical protein
MNRTMLDRSVGRAVVALLRPRRAQDGHRRGNGEHNWNDYERGARSDQALKWRAEAQRRPPAARALGDAQCDPPAKRSPQDDFSGLELRIEGGAFPRQRLADWRDGLQVAVTPAQRNDASYIVPVSGRIHRASASGGSHPTRMLPHILQIWLYSKLEWTSLSC